MRVSIGMPVYNGEQFIAEAIDSILAQSFGDFELIISDNASTDATQQICEKYAKREPRIRYWRLPENLGAARNYNHVFKMSSGTYFKWAAHDDILHPEFLSRCVRAFESFDTPPSLIYPQTELIDETGKVVSYDRCSLNADSRSLLVRVVRLSQVLKERPMVTPIFGLYYRDILAKTRLIGSFVSSDFVLLLESALLGRVIQIDGDPLFQRRIHPDMSRKVNVSDQDALRWFDPAAASKLSAHQRLIVEYFRSIMACGDLSIGAKGLSAISVILTIGLKSAREDFGRWRRQVLQHRAAH